MSFNPIRWIDSEGRGPTDVIITGGASYKALEELQKSVFSELTLKMDDKGKVSFTQNNPKSELSGDAQKLANAINDH